MKVSKLPILRNGRASRFGTYADCDGAALSALLGGQRVRETEVGAPVTTSDGDDAELGDNDGGTDSSRDFLGGLDAETDVALRITDDDDGLEAGTLTGAGLLLDRLDLHGNHCKHSISSNCGDAPSRPCCALS